MKRLLVHCRPLLLGPCPSYSSRRPARCPARFSIARPATRSWVRLFFLEGTQIGVTCDIEGTVFSFSMSRPGPMCWASSMIGYQDASIIGVEVQDDEVRQADHHPHARGIRTGRTRSSSRPRPLRNTGAALLKERQKAPAVSDAISAEEISRAGSGDAAEGHVARKRVPP